MVRDRGRATDQVHSWSKYPVGTIFSTVHHTHSRNQTFDESKNKDQSMTRMGLVNSKERKFVVIRKFPRHVWALLIGTQGGNGLNYVANSNRWEYVSVREDINKAIAAPAESEHEILWTTTNHSFKAIEPSNFFQSNDVTSLRLTQPTSHDFKVKASISGKLLGESQERLKVLFAKFCGEKALEREPLQQLTTTQEQY